MHTLSCRRKTLLLLSVEKPFTAWLFILFLGYLCASVCVLACMCVSMFKLPHYNIQFTMVISLELNLLPGDFRSAASLVLLDLFVLSVIKCLDTKTPGPFTKIQIYQKKKFELI